MKISKKLQQEFTSKNVLLLQGPVGNFFHHLAIKMKKKQTKVFKLNFNGGDFFSILVERGVSAMKKILKISIEIFFKAKKSMLF